MVDSVTALARKWCPWGHDGPGTAPDHGCVCGYIKAAVREALAPPKDSSDAILAMLNKFDDADKATFNWLVRAARDEARREALEEQLHTLERMPLEYPTEPAAVALPRMIAALRGGTR